jgi:hypothetical protein
MPAWAIVVKERPISTSKPYDLSRSLTALEQDTALVAVIEMSRSPPSFYAGFAPQGRSANCTMRW